MEHIIYLHILLAALGITLLVIIVFLIIRIGQVLDNINLMMENIERKKRKLNALAEVFGDTENLVLDVVSRLDIVTSIFSGISAFFRVKKENVLNDRDKKCIVIYNPKSGKFKKRNLFRVLYRLLDKYGYETTIIATEYKGHACDIVANLGYADLVISAGGDGTLSDVIRGNLKRENKLLIANLPLGSTNDVATMYGYTKNYKKNLELLLNGQIQNIDVCMINNCPFVYVAAFGNYVDVSYATPRKLKEKYGHLAYILYGLKILKQNIRHYDIKYKIDGKTETTNGSFFFVTNSTRIAGVNNVYEDIKLDDGLFEVLICDIKNKRDIVKRINDIQWMNVADIPNFKYYRTNNLTIEFESAPQASWCIDGEELTERTRKYTFKINNETQMLIPKKNIKKLFLNRKK